MIELSERFKEANGRVERVPSWIVEFESKQSLWAESSTSGDWQSASSYQNVDLSGSPGDVLLYAPPSEGSSSYNAVVALKSPVDSDNDGVMDGSTIQPQWQSFTPQADCTIRAVRLLLMLDITDPNLDTTETITVELWDSAKSSLLGSSTLTVGFNADKVPQWVEFGFPTTGGGEITLSGSARYWLKIYCGSAPYNRLYLCYNSGGVPGGFDSYPSGELSTGALDDGCFYVDFAYPPSGSITTATLDLGTTPVVDGVWVFRDTAPLETTVSYEAWASHTGSFSGEELYLGTVEDGQPITVRRRYYRVRAVLSTTNRAKTPMVHSIRAYFASFLKWADHLATGHEPAVLGISSLETTIDDFKPSTIGTISIRLARTPAVEDYMLNHYPVGKQVVVKAGFIHDGFTEDDYMLYYTGRIDRYRLDGEGVFVVNLKDPTTSWKQRIPKKWESTADDISWNGVHPVDCMLDILERIGIRGSEIDRGSFNMVKAALTGWQIKRTLTGNSYKADRLLEELRQLTGTYFIPRGDGRIRLKLYDSSEPAVAELTDDVLVNIGWDANTEGVLNELLLYYGWLGGGDELREFSALHIELDASSQQNWGTHRLEVKDRWTPATQGWQAQQRAHRVVKRFSKKPTVVEVELDRSYLWLEVGDMVTLTSTLPPGGVTQKKFQIIRRNVDFFRETVKLRLLGV